MEQKVARSRVAVIGLGLTGTGTLKNLLEEGFDAVGFDRNGYVGGLWEWNPKADQTTVLKTTRSNISKQRGCYQDYPFPKEVPDYPTAAQVSNYISDYAKHFGLLEHCRLKTKVQWLERSPDKSKWQLRFLDAQNEQKTELFDRVIVTTGSYAKAFTPKIEGVEHFHGKIVHAQGFKDAQDYVGQNVMVVGLSNTGSDIAVDLAAVAKQTYMAHRSGAKIISRGKPGSKPLDHTISRRVASIGQLANTLFPKTMMMIGAYVLKKRIMKANPFIKPEWGLFHRDDPPMSNSPPAMNDYILEKFREGSIISVPGVKHFLPDGKSIELVDGRIIPDIDAVVFGTGYYSEYDILAPEANPTSNSPSAWESHKHANGLAYPRLYQGLLHPSYPDTLAFIGPFRGHSFSAFSNSDLSSQAIVQLWLGNYPMPSKAEMDLWCDENFEFALSQIQAWRIGKVGTNPRKLEKWLNDVSGNEVNEKVLNLTSWECWRFWWKERQLYRLIVDGVDTPYLYRLFEGRKGANGERRGRKAWDGARRAIYETNGKTWKG